MGARLYLAEGTLSAGTVKLIIGPWTPGDADHANNNPSLGERRYLRFEVLEADSVYDEMLRMQGFMAEEEALSGFTDEAVLFEGPPSRGFL